MKYLKLLFKILIGLVGLLIILKIFVLSVENYETITKKNGNEIAKIEIQKVFGKKISECTINADGFYHGPSEGWYLFKGALKSSGNFKNGYWNGLWRVYDRNSNLKMRIEYNMGVPIKIFLPDGTDFRELPKNEWPEHFKFKQSRPQRAHKKQMARYNQEAQVDSQGTQVLKNRGS